MKVASVTDLKNGLSAYLKEVVSGETVLVMDRKKPVAVFQPITSEYGDERLAGLVASGIVSAPAGRLDLEAFFAEPRGLTPNPSGLTGALLEEREGR
ncbi:MAG: type II toxin-antitoxin system Phd/YefM family antitoxin [Verrucomicrobia bacterium]|nr:type II toxin-antitoxin system Phd/YefM family antitoxin [Verrucomicrobiota bacterium]